MNWVFVTLAEAWAKREVEEISHWGRCNLKDKGIVSLPRRSKKYRINRTKVKNKQSPKLCFGCEKRYITQIQ